MSLVLSVLVHSGDVHGGHYSAFIKPQKDAEKGRQWFKFDDDKVTPVTLRDVYEENFGGEAPHLKPGMKPVKRFTNAYMLVYIRESAMDEILSAVTEANIPEHLGGSYLSYLIWRQILIIFSAF